MLGEWALSMVGVEEGREFRFCGDLYSQESTFPLVSLCKTCACQTLGLISSGHLAIIAIPVALVLYASSARVVTTVYRAKTPEPIKLPFGIWTLLAERSAS